MKHKPFGFSLLEMLIVLAIVGILSAMAIPTYREYLLSTQRHNAWLTLLAASNQAGNYHIVHDSYAEMNLNDLKLSQSSVNNAYRFRIAEVTEDNFLLTATPIESQSKDICGQLSIDAMDNQHAGESDVLSCLR